MTTVVEVDGRKHRMLRGRALVRRDVTELGEHTLASGIVVPGTMPLAGRQGYRIHRGTVLALGAPALEHPRERVERPWECEVGDVVLFVYGIALEKVRAWDDLVFVAHEEIQAVMGRGVELEISRPKWVTGEVRS